MPEEPVAGTTADPTLRFTELKLGKKKYQLIYDFENIARAEEMTGLELLVGVNWRKVRSTQIRAMLYASMLKAQPETTLEEITPMLRPINMPRIESALFDCWIASTPDENTDEKKPDPENPPQPGEKS